MDVDIKELDLVKLQNLDLRQKLLQSEVQRQVAALDAERAALEHEIEMSYGLGNIRDWRFDMAARKAIPRETKDAPT